MTDTRDDGSVEYAVERAWEESCRPEASMTTVRAWMAQAMGRMTDGAYRSDLEAGRIAREAVAGASRYSHTHNALMLVALPALRRIAALTNSTGSVVDHEAAELIDNGASRSPMSHNDSTGSEPDNEEKDDGPVEATSDRREGRTGRASQEARGVQGHGGVLPSAVGGAGTDEHAGAPDDGVQRGPRGSDRRVHEHLTDDGEGRSAADAAALTHPSEDGERVPWPESCGQCGDHTPCDRIDCGFFDTPDDGGPDHAQGRHDDPALTERERHVASWIIRRIGEMADDVKPKHLGMMLQRDADALDGGEDER